MTILTDAKPRSIKPEDKPPCSRWHYWLDATPFYRQGQRQVGIRYVSPLQLLMAFVPAFEAGAASRAMRGISLNEH